MMSLTRRMRRSARLQNNLAVLEHKIDWYQGKVDATIAEDESFEAYLNRLDQEEKHD
jgi:hypothetical protein